MPSRANKRTRRATQSGRKHEELSFNTRSKRKDSLHSTGGAVKPYHAKETPASPDTATSTPITQYTDSPDSSKKRKHEQIDSDSEYEHIRVLKGKPSARDPTELPIVATTANGERKIIWAKMDTGADINIIAEKLVDRLGRTADIEPVSPVEDKLEIREIGGNEITIDRKIKLSFRAGRKHVLCEDVEFWIPRQEMDTDTDGVADVLLGWRELAKHHMVMIDPDFCNDPEDGLEVLSRPARDEADKPAICLGTKYPQVRVKGR